MPAIGRRLLVTLGATLLLTACGSSAPTANGRDVAAVKATITRAFHALARGDGAAVCALATASGQRTLASAVPHASCAKVVALASRRLTPDERAALASVVIKHVALSGGRAAVTDADLSARRGSLKGFIDPQSKPTGLTKQPDGAWKISG